MKRCWRNDKEWVKLIPLIQSLINNGITYFNRGKRLNCDRATIHRVVRRFGLKGPREVRREKLLSKL